MMAEDGITISRWILALLLFFAAFIGPAWGQTTATDWFYKGMILYEDNKFNESIQTFDLESEHGKLS